MPSGAAARIRRAEVEIHPQADGLGVCIAVTAILLILKQSNECPKRTCFPSHQHVLENNKCEVDRVDVAPEIRAK